MRTKTEEEVVLEILINSHDALIDIGKHQAAVEALRAKQAQYRAEVKADAGNKEKYREDINKTTQAIKAEQDAIRILTKEVQNNVKQETAAADSITGMRAKLSNLTAEYYALSEAEREGTKGEGLKKQIGTLDGSIRSAEQSLGDFRRQVGNYAVATKSIRTELKELTEQLAQMAIAGKQGTDEYEEILKRTSELRDTYGDVQREVGVGASDTKGLDRVKGAADALAGSFTMLNSIQGIFTKDQEQMTVIVQKVQIGIGALSAAIALQNALQKQEIIMNTVVIIQSKAKIAALAMETKGTLAATVAQRIFNVVAKANPYVLLATLLITVIGALVAFASSSETAAEKQEKLNEKTKAAGDYLDYEMKKLDDVSGARIKAAETELALAKAQGVSADKIEQLEQGIYLAKKQRAGQMTTLAADEIKNLDDNIKQMDYLQTRLKELKIDQANGNTDYKPSVVIDGKVMYFEFEEALKECQSQIDITGKAIEVGTKAKLDVSEVEAAEKERLAAKAKADGEKAVANAKDRRQKELEAIRAAQDAVFELVKEGQQKESAAVKFKFARQIEDLKKKLRDETNLSVKAKIAINVQIKALEQQQTQELAKIDQTYTRATFDKQLEEQELFIANRLVRAKEGSQVEFNLQMQSIETQMEAEIETNNRRVEAEQIDETLIRDKYAAMREQATKNREKQLAADELKRAQLEIENKVLAAQLDGGDVLQAKYEAKQAEIAALAELEFTSNEERINREKQLALELQGIEAEIQDAKRQKIESTLTAFGGLANALGQLMENMGEDNEQMAGFIKGMAIFEVAMNTAVAISNAIATATKTGATVWDMIAGIAAGVAAVIAAVAQSTAIINKSKQPKAPKLNKYATGGVIDGPGGATSDSIPAMLSAGESVMTALTTSMFAPILSSFNQIGGGVPIQIHNASAAVMGEDMLARAFAKGAASLPSPVVDVREVAAVQSRLAVIESLRTF